MSIKPCPVPANALLARYVGDHAYTDCYRVEIAAAATQVQYINVFYTSWLFKLERAILAWAASRPSTDAEVKQLALGEIECFSAWHVEDRNDNQLLLSDFRDRTRSWLMALPAIDPNENAAVTTLYFGSAVVARRGADGEVRTGLLFGILLGFHKIYSKVLLHSAKTRLLSEMRRVG